MKIALCSSEVVPFAKTGGLADVASALSVALDAQNAEVALITPFYKKTKDNGGWKRNEKGIPYSLIGKKIKVYFAENDAYFNRNGLYGDRKGDYPDNLERFSFYCLRTAGILKEAAFKPDIIHCHDWQSALLAVYLKARLGDDDFFGRTKSLLTIHNIGYQGIFEAGEFPKLGLNRKLSEMPEFEFYGKVNLLKAGIIYSDGISTVSPGYRNEILTKEFGFGLEGVLSQRRDSLSGILNGLDYSIWNPATDSYISKNYDSGTLKSKSENKAFLRKLCGFKNSPEFPLIGIVSRLAGQKGFDILAESLKEIFKMGIEMVILGTGEERYRKILKRIAARYPKVMHLALNFDEGLAHQIYAGADIFLMPSSYEPCGLGQMISLKYATIPLVFKTGGLADTVNKNNGFLFEEYSASELIGAVARAVETFRNKEKWQVLMKNAAACDFSWESAAKEYISLYEKISRKA